MAIDSYARLLGMAALANIQDMGDKAIDRVYIADGHLHIVFMNGTDSDLGRVVGTDGVTYVPHIDEYKNLTWTIQTEPGPIPPPVDLDPNNDWEEIDGDGSSDYFWEPIVE